MHTFIKENCSFEGKLLLVSAISAGDVPTLALDHLIVLNEFQRVAYFHSDYLEPSVGYLPQNIEGGALGLPGEIYMRGDMLFLQFRSAVRFGRKKDLAKQISSFAKANSIKDVVVLASLPYEIKQDLQITAAHKNIYCKSKGEIGGGISIKKCLDLRLVHPFEALKKEDEEEEIILKNAGLSKALLKEFDNLLVLMIFNEKPEDKETAVYFSTQLGKIIDRKEIGRTN